MAVQMGRDAGCGGGEVGRTRGVGAFDTNPLCREPQHLGRRPAVLEVHALPHLHRPGAEADAAVAAEMNERLTLAQRGMGEGDPEGQRQAGQPLLVHLIGGIEVGDAPLPTRQIVAGPGLLPTGVGAAAICRHAEREAVSFLEKAAGADHVRRDTALPGCSVDRAFQDEYPLGRAEAAHGREGREMHAAAPSGGPQMRDRVRTGGMEEERVGTALERSAYAPAF